MERENFGMEMDYFNQAAKERIKIEKNDDTDEELAQQFSQVLREQNEMLQLIAEERASDPEAQERILQLQIYKQYVLSCVRKKEVAIDYKSWENEQSGRHEKRPKPRKVYQENGHYFISGGDKKEITLGDLQTDGEWGIVYDLDPKTFSKEFRNKYFLDECTRKLQQAFDLQIIIDRASSEETNPKTRRSFNRILKDEASEKRIGLFAESLVKSYFHKLYIDNPNLPFKVVAGGVLRDVSDKIDLVVIFPAHLRGVNTTIGEAKFGIQFSTNPRASEYKTQDIEEAKKRTVDFVQDILLVIFSENELNTIKYDWETHGHISGGPERYMSEDCKKHLFDTVLNGIFTTDQIDSFWEKLTNSEYKSQNQTANTNLNKLQPAF